MNFFCLRGIDQTSRDKDRETTGGVTTLFMGRKSFQEANDDTNEVTKLSTTATIEGMQQKTSPVSSMSKINAPARRVRGN